MVQWNKREVLTVKKVKRGCLSVKKKLWLLAAAACLLGWFVLRPETVEGSVADYRTDPHVFELALRDGTHYGILIDEDTQVRRVDGPTFGGRDEPGMQYLGAKAWVSVTLGSRIESPWPEYDSCVAGWYRAKKVLVEHAAPGTDFYPAPGKPVIYLYPEEVTDVTVKLDYDGELTAVYPAYDGLWSVTAAPDGTLTDAKGMEYNYLYWEGVGPAEYDWSTGFCVAGADTAAFLEEALARLGLTRREANEFIVYWLPLMEDNPYNLITFQGERYTDTAKLTVHPAPDTVIRVFMAWKPLAQPVEIGPQTLTAPDRTGFTLVEWGGARME